MRDPPVAETILAARDDQLRQRFRDSGQRLSNLYMAEHGYQAGFEQQVFQLLEHADVSFDWSIIEKLEHEAGRPIEE
jgi:hypothetical protein